MGSEVEASIDITTFGTTIEQDDMGKGLYMLPDGTFNGQLKRINLYRLGFGRVVARISSTTFIDGNYFWLRDYTEKTSQAYVLFRWNNITWVPIESVGGGFQGPRSDVV
jgi:hypothetical protein